MAKTSTKKFYGDLNCKITPSSKNTTYVQMRTNGNYNYKFKVSTAKFRLTEYTNFAYRVGNNLVIKTFFYSGANYAAKKTVLTTFKDYFTENASGEFNNIKICGVTYSFDITTAPGSNGLFGVADETEDRDFLIASSEDNAEFSLTKGGCDFIYDTAGADTYNFSYPYNEFKKWDTVWDFAGNDKYKLSNNTNVYTYDYKGSDEYEVNASSATTVDVAGNDKYTITNLDKTNFSEVFTTDKKGNDIYNVSNSSLKNFNCLRLYEVSGDDKYNFDSVTFESYANIYQDDFSIVDKYGNDEYVLTKVKHLTIFDAKGKDKYRLNDSAYTGIKDSLGNDTYEISNSGATIYDKSGNDKYIIKNLQKLEYKNAVISDLKGTDTLKLQGINKNNLVFMSNFSNNSNSKYRDKNASLIIYDKEKGGFVTVSKFFKDSNSDGKYEKGFGKGKIETIKAGEDKINQYISRTNMNAVKQAVGSWLATTDYNCVSDLLTRGSEPEINILIAKFKGE